VQETLVPNGRFHYARTALQKLRAIGPDIHKIAEIVEVAEGPDKPEYEKGEHDGFYAKIDSALEYLPAASATQSLLAGPWLLHRERADPGLRALWHSVWEHMIPSPAEILINRYRRPYAKTIHDGERGTISEAVCFVSILHKKPPGSVPIRRLDINQCGDITATQSGARFAGFRMPHAVTHQRDQLVEYVVARKQAALPGHQDAVDGGMVGIARIEMREPSTSINKDTIHHLFP